MVVKPDMRLYEQGLEEYPRLGIIFGNFMMILWIVLGTTACWFLHPLFAWIYLAFGLIIAGIALRKLFCTNCYYYDRWCSIGWGKLSHLFFKRGNIEEFNTNAGQKLAPLTYGLLSVIPIVLIAVSMFWEFSISRVIVLVLLLSISFYSGGIGRKKACERCKMRLICRGSALK